MIVKEIKFLLTGLIIVIIGCQSEHPKVDQTGPANNLKPKTEMIELIYDELPVNISIEGYIRPWKVNDITFPDTTRMISILFENGMDVRKGELVASLWKANPDFEYTPLDINAPFDGVIRNLRYKINQTVPPDEPVMQIVNYDQFILALNMPAYKTKFLAKGLAASISVGNLVIEGKVSLVNENTGAMVITFINRQRLRPAVDQYVSGYIVTKPVKGTFLPKNQIGDLDSLSVLIDPDIEMEIKFVGEADSLVLIDPPLPYTNQIKKIKKDFDLPLK